MKVILSIVFILFHCSIYCQIFTSSKEIIKTAELNLVGYLGHIDLSPRYYNAEDEFTAQFDFYKLDEKSMELVISDDLFNPPFRESNWATGFLRLQGSSNRNWFYSVGYMNDDYTIYYQNLWLQYKGKDHFLDSIYNADKLIHSSFSADGRYLLVNTLSTYSDYYNPVQDNRIMVYDLSELDKGKVGKEHIPCTHCADSYLVGNQLFFTIGEEDGYGGFGNKNIYVAPWGSLKDSVKVAENTDIMAITPDGRYILGTRFWDKQKTTAVIVDVEHKKYQMLLGRDYADQRAFYSHHESKFAFDFEGYLIYVDFPKSYPFDALKWRNEEIPYWTEKEFWQQYEHKPLPER